MIWVDTLVLIKVKYFLKNVQKNVYNKFKCDMLFPQKKNFLRVKNCVYTNALTIEVYTYYKTQF